MKYTFTFALVAAHLAAALPAVDLSQIPACASSAISTGILSSGCSLTNYECICSATGFLEALQAKVAQACDAADQKSSEEFASSLCSSAGINLNLAPPPESLSSTAAAAANEPTSAAAVASPAGSAIASIESPGANAASVPAAATAPVYSATPTYAATTGSLNSSSNGTAGAPVYFQGGAVGLSVQWALMSIVAILYLFLFV